MVIISNLVLMISFFFMVFVFLSLFTGSFPFVLILSVAYGTAARFSPSHDDQTYTYGHLLNFMSILIAIIGIIGAVIMKLVRKKNDIEVCKKMRYYFIFNAILMNTVMLFVLLLGIQFFSNTERALEICANAANDRFERHPHCKDVCKRGEWGSATKRNC